MTRGPDFDELLGRDVDAAERERLRRVHELLITAGPPPELSPEIELGPTLAMTLPARQGPRVQRRVLLLAAAVLVLALAFLGGYLAGNGGGNGLSAGTTLKLSGTSAAPAALASLEIEPRDPSGNWPMKLSATGLPKLPEHGYYTVWLMRNGKPYAPCGVFVVAAKSSGVSIWLNAPYRLQPGDTWVVTKHLAGTNDAGPVVLRPNV
ncbi:MAG TPA: hypothetical protein VGN27_10660 [Gaiellaceae bacterium]|jgi:hypothetical protein|nr:hypothetical protein [Gaiellaceae bacterium]